MDILKLYCLVSLVVTSLFDKIFAINTVSDEATLDSEQHQQIDDISTKKRDLPCREFRPCEPCNKLELEIHDVCTKTGYRNVMRCADSSGHKDVFESCPNGLKSFWIFEIVMLFAGIICGNLTMFRRRHLERLVKDRIMEQIQNTA